MLSRSLISNMCGRWAGKQLFSIMKGREESGISPFYAEDVTVQGGQFILIKPDERINT